MTPRLCLPVPSSTNNSRNDPHPWGLGGPWVTDGGQKGLRSAHRLGVSLGGGRGAYLMGRFIVDIKMVSDRPLGLALRLLGN